MRPVDSQTARSTSVACARSDRKTGLRLVPDVRREWSFDVLLEGTAANPLRTLDGALEPLAGAQLSAALWAARGTKGTVAFVDLDGTSYRAYFADLKEAVAKLPHRDGWQTRARVTLVEA